jgi:uncharacterized metal-binding protein YceD (DUF177 family)
MKKFIIDIYRMRNQLHQFEYEIDESFFGNFEQDLLKQGKLHARIDLEKNDSFIHLAVDLQGTVELTCDRSLDKFQHPIEESCKVVFKYGDEEREIDHDVVMITRDTQQIDVGQYIFEFISLAIPMKKLHPRFNDDEGYGSLVYSSENIEEEQAVKLDPRWDKLKRLKKN